MITDVTTLPEQDFPVVILHSPSSRCRPAALLHKVSFSIVSPKHWLATVKS